MFKKILAYLPLFIFILIVLAIIFRWDIKTISYKEEVKLSDGSFIWVDIKRHYIPTTSALGDGAPFTLRYKPSIVEISWDTGFLGVGRQSVFFDGGVILLDKIDGAWYVVGGKPSFDGAYKGSKAVNCRNAGIYLQRNACMYILQSSNNLAQPLSNPELFIAPIKVNILTLTGLYDWVHNAKNLNNTRLTWSDKLRIDRTIKDKHRQSLDKPFSEF